MTDKKQPMVALHRCFAAPDDLDTAWNLAQKQIPAIQEFPGLVQKYFWREPETGYIGGLYVFEDEPTLRRYQQSELGQFGPQNFDLVEERTFQVLATVVPPTPVQA